MPPLPGQSSDRRHAGLPREIGSRRRRTPPNLTHGVEISDRRRQIVFAEQGPHPIGEPEFGEGGFPEQEVGEALFAAGADQQVDRADARVPAISRSRSASEAAGPSARGLGDGFAGGVVESDAQVEARLTALIGLDPRRPRRRYRRAAGRGGRAWSAARPRRSAAAHRWRDSRRNRPISASTSHVGRRQLAQAKANRVSVVTPRSGAASTVRRTASAPAQWPSERLRPWRTPQRPLPSMMIATWKGGVGIVRLCIAKYPSKKRAVRRGRGRAGGLRSARTSPRSPPRAPPGRAPPGSPGPAAGLRA